MKKISSGEHPGGALTINHLVILAGVTLKLGKLAKFFSSFNACPSLSCVATANGKQFQWLNIDWDIVFLM